MKRSWQSLLLLAVAPCLGCGDDTGVVGGDASATDAGDRTDADVTPDAGMTSDVNVTPDASSMRDGGGRPPEPRFVGRYDDSDPSAVSMSWSGSGFVVRFRGTAARVRMNDAGHFFTVVVDGEVQPTLAVSGGVQTYELADGLPDTEHTVEVYRQTEGSFGSTVIQSIEVDGELLAVPEPERQIEVVGDSISAGYGAEGADMSCDFSAETENHFLTYEAVAARELGAELSTVAWSGKGVIYNYGDDRFQPMPELYDRVLADVPGSTGVIRQADAVVINLGTNDFSTDGDPSEGEFVPAYEGLLEAVRARHPEARIFCTVAPPLAGSDGTRATSYIQSAIAGREAAGDERVEWIDIDAGIVDWGCDYHPGDETHAAMADVLVATLRAELGW